MIANYHLVLIAMLMMMTMMMMMMMLMIYDDDDDDDDSRLGMCRNGNADLCKLFRASINVELCIRLEAGAGNDDDDDDD